MAPAEDKTAPSPGRGNPPAGDAPVAAELGFILCLAALAAAVAWQALTLPVFAPDGTVGPGFFPIPLSLLLLVGSLLYAVALLRRLRHSQGESGKDLARPPLLNARQIAALGLLALAALLGSTLGLFATVGLLLLFGLLSVERLRLLESAAFTLGALIVFYLVFDAALGMNIGLNGMF